MKILAFETSCDDTSLAIFEDENLVFMETKTQIKIHKDTGGVVPEIAARIHAESIFKILDNVLKKSFIKLENLDYIAVTKTPGLIPSLLTWLTVAKTLWNILKIPIIEINHIESHIFSNFLERKRQDIKFPLVCLTVSWWHNEIYYMKDMFSMEKIWATQDDSAWEAFDKVSKMMWLWYPGWPIISKLAKEYEDSLVLSNKKKAIFPRVWLDKSMHDFSFSGLKSAVKREIDKRILKNEEILKKSSDSLKKQELVEIKNRGEILLTLGDKKEIAYEFENAVTEVLSYKLINAWFVKWVKNIMLTGWVSANNKLVDLVNEKSKKEDFSFTYPAKKIYCCDNAAMVGINAYYRIKFLGERELEPSV